MIKEFRFKGLTPQGRLIQSNVIAASKRDAKKMIEDLAKRNNVRVTDINQKLKYKFPCKFFLNFFNSPSFIT